MRIRNTILIVAFCMILIGPFSLWVIQSKMNIHLPDYLTSEEATFLSGGISDVTLKGKISINGFTDKDLQEALEEKVGNFIPAKAKALLTNAYLQRTAISTSNCLFNWDCYPTFYGSNNLVIPAQGSVSIMPDLEKETIPKLSALCKRLKRFSKENPDMGFRLYIVDYAYTSNTNPAQKYLSHAATTQDVIKYLDNRLKDQENVEVLTDYSSDLDEFYKYFYRSDHHWNANGVFRAYKTLFNNNENVRLLQKDGYVDVDGPLFSGSYTRSGLYIVEDKPIDFSYQFDEVDLAEDGIEENGSEHTAYFESSKQRKHWEFYDLYYEDFAKATDNKNKKNALVIADSFGRALLRPISLNYEKVYFYTYMHFADTNNARLQKLISKHDISDVIFVGHSPNYTTFASRHPHFFDTKS